MPTATPYPKLELPVGALLEGFVTTLKAARTTNISPMGPIVDPEWTCLRLRPFTSSTTYNNLQRHGEAASTGGARSEVAHSFARSTAPPGVQLAPIARAHRARAMEVVLPQV